MDHKHLLVNCTYKETPFTDESFTENWLKEIVEKIDMEILYPPKAVKCLDKGNEGITAFCMITTSHICLHSWEKSDPNLVQFDVYSCKDFSQSLILDEMKKFKPIRIGCRFINRGLPETKNWEMGREELF